MRSKPTPKSDFLGAALRLFAQNGFAATTTRQITDEFGRSPVALYYYFSSKTDLGLLRLQESQSYQANRPAYDPFLDSFLKDLTDLFPS